MSAANDLRAPNSETLAAMSETEDILVGRKQVYNLDSVGDEVEG